MGNTLASPMRNQQCQGGADPGSSLRDV